MKLHHTEFLPCLYLQLQVKHNKGSRPLKVTDLYIVTVAETGISHFKISYLRN